MSTHPRALAPNKILVFGSLNVDLVQTVPRVLIPGETLKGSDLQIHIGGKGANQACAAALLGGQVHMAGCVGNDAFADRVLARLGESGVDTSKIRMSQRPSGTASIFVLPDGDNMIVISPGANADNSPESARAAVDTLNPGDFLLCQLEVPIESVAAAIDAAEKKGVTTFLDPAPACELPPDLLKKVNILTPNQSEASFLLGEDKPVETMSQAETAAKVLQSKGAQVVIVKMGKQGCLVATRESVTRVPGFAANVVDTTAAGDTFNGALAVGLAEGWPMAHAVGFAHAAASIAVTRRGAIDSMPARTEVDKLIDSVQLSN